MNWLLIEKRLKEMRMSKETFAGKIGRTVGTIENMKKGRTPSALTLLLVSKVIGVAVEDLMIVDTNGKSLHTR